MNPLRALPYWFKIHINFAFTSTSRSYKYFMNFSSFTQLFLQLLMKIKTSVWFVLNTFTFMAVKVAGQIQMLCMTFLANNDLLYFYLICVLILFTYSWSHTYVLCPSRAADIYIYIYIYICMCVCVCVCVLKYLYILQTYFYYFNLIACTIYF